MKLFFFSGFFILTSFFVYSQDISGTWSGALSIQGTSLRIVFHINKTDSGYTSTMDSPDQGVNGIPVDKTTFVTEKISISMDKLKLLYEASIKGDSLFSGTFKQGGMSFPLDLKRGVMEKVKINRPQEPAKPYPYVSEDVTFNNKKDSVRLSGTITLPNKDGVFPAVILISGSGPQNREEELLGHKPFLVLSDFLTRNGFAVLRYDDRGVGKSKGIFSTATSYDFSNDAEAAFEYLQNRKEIRKDKIGLVGHSEGGIIAPMIAARNKDVGFVVMLAGPGLPGDKVILRQQELIGRIGGESEGDIKKNKSLNKKIYAVIYKNKSQEETKKDVSEIVKKMVEKDTSFLSNSGVSAAEFISLKVRESTSPWFIYFINHDPRVDLKKVTCPVLAINGDKDLQVYSKDNLPAIEKSLKKGGNKKYMIKEIPGVNHLFQECKTGSPDEYSEIEQTMSPGVLNEILGWMKGIL